MYISNSILNNIFFSLQLESQRLTIFELLSYMFSSSLMFLQAQFVQIIQFKEQKENGFLYYFQIKSYKYAWEFNKTE